MYFLDELPAGECYSLKYIFMVNFFEAGFLWWIRLCAVRIFPLIPLWSRFGCHFRLLVSVFVYKYTKQESFCIISKAVCKLYCFLKCSVTDIRIGPLVYAGFGRNIFKVFDFICRKGCGRECGRDCR